MGKNSARAEATRKAAEMRAAAARKERQQKQLITAAVAVVVVIIAVVIGLAITSQPDKTPAASNTGADAAIAKLSTIPTSAFDAAGKPAAANNAVPQKIDGGTVLKNGDKPEVLYVGAEFCPYCATERWSLVAALNRFGSVTGLTPTRSADNEGNIPTVSFQNLKYTSDYIAFRAIETQDRNHQELQKIPPDIEALFTKYDAPPYVQGQAGSIPWTFYGTHQTVGSGVPVQSFLNLTDESGWSKVVEQMLTGKGDLGQPIMANANAITAQICTLTGNKPDTVCSSPAVVQTAPMLKP